MVRSDVVDLSGSLNNALRIADDAVAVINEECIPARLPVSSVSLLGRAASGLVVVVHFLSLVSITSTAIFD